MLPTDVIYNVIFPFIVGREICNTSDFGIFCINKRLYNSKPTCFSAPKIKFGTQMWCKIHSPHEYTFSQYIKSQIAVQPQEEPTNFFSSEDKGYLRDNLSLTYHDYTHTYTPNDLLYYWKRVVDSSPYEVTHLCCGGNGIEVSLVPL